MNNRETIQRLRLLRMGVMAQLHKQHLETNRMTEATPDRYLSLLVDSQWEDRERRKIERLLRGAGFRIQATLAEVDYAPGRELDRNSFERLGSLGFIERKENIIITGPTGLGKSYLAQALGHQACMVGYKTLYQNTARLFRELRQAKNEGTYIKALSRLIKMDLLIIDDFGLQGLDRHARESMMDLIDERYEVHATIIVGQIPVSAWHGIIGEGTIADALLDRLVHSSHRVALKGESMRKQKKVINLKK